MEDNCLSYICGVLEAHRVLTQLPFVKATSCVLIFENTRIFTYQISLVMGANSICVH